VNDEQVNDVQEVFDLRLLRDHDILHDQLILLCLIKSIQCSDRAFISQVLKAKFLHECSDSQIIVWLETFDVLPFLMLIVDKELSLIETDSLI